jgi:hypothetical protein
MKRLMYGLALVVAVTVAGQTIVAARQTTIVMTDNTNTNVSSVDIYAYTSQGYDGQLDISPGPSAGQTAYATYPWQHASNGPPGDSIGPIVVLQGQTHGFSCTGNFLLPMGPGGQYPASDDLVEITITSPPSASSYGACTETVIQNLNLPNL